MQEVSCADIGTPVTVNVFANDGNGNSAVCSAVVTVVDLLAPEIVCPDDQVVNLDPDGTILLEITSLMAVQQLPITVPILLLYLVKIQLLVLY